MDNRGVSEVLGFVLIFSLVTVTMGYVYVGGTDGLSDRRDAERVNNVERAFDVLADNIEDVSQRGAPSRATEIKLADARLSAGDPVVLNVTAEHSSADSGLDISQKNYTLDPIVYDGGTDARFVYASGAVVRQQSDGSVMLRSPSMVARDDRVVLPIVLTNVESNGVAGSTTVRIRTTHRETTLLHADHDPGSYSLTVRLETSRAETWRRYFDPDPTTDTDSPFDCSTGENSATVVTCKTIGTEEVYVLVGRVNVVFE